LFLRWAKSEPGGVTSFFLRWGTEPNSVEGGGATTLFLGSLKCTVIAPRSSGEEEHDVKPFDGTLRVINPVRQSRASSRKRVLRGDGRPSLRSVDSEIKRYAIEPRN